MCWIPLHAQINTNNVNTCKTCAVLQITGGIDEPNIVLCGNRNKSQSVILLGVQKIEMYWVVYGKHFHVKD